jgi:hypothetical protein
MKQAHIILVGTLVLSTATLMACIWDTDTLAAEKERLPEIEALITGTFPRHSHEFHEWRRDKCKQLIGNHAAQVHTYDDLAVSLHKLGDHKAAIQIMQAKELLFPGLYETRSNLGTFYIYTGDLDEALKWIDEALAINPNAHFGREKYQRWLVEWLQERQKTGVRKLSPEDFELRAEGIPYGFAEFVARKEHAASGQIEKTEITLHQLDDAIFGISGMMRFADFDNPLLLEALGDLLMAGHVRTNAALLSCLCYLQASRKADSDLEKARLRASAEAAGIITPDFKLERYMKLLDTGLAKGLKSAESIRKDEMAWIAAGIDASAEFQKKYMAAK